MMTSVVDLMGRCRQAVGRPHAGSATQTGGYLPDGDARRSVVIMLDRADDRVDR